MTERVETTYADLRPTDLVIDKAGNAWPIAELETSPVSGSEIWQKTFWLCDPVSKVKQHWMLKFYTDPVTVSRIPSHADEASKLEAEFPDSGEVKPTEAEMDAHEIEKYGRVVSKDDNYPSMVEAVVAVEDIGGTVEAEVTAQEVDAAAAATEDAPVVLPPFDSMTPLERRSHLYLLHGIYATDVRSNDELVSMHDAAGSVQSKTVPHVHEAK